LAACADGDRARGLMPTPNSPPGSCTTPGSGTTTYDDAAERVQVAQPMSTVKTFTRSWNVYNTSWFQLIGFRSLRFLRQWIQ
jgi:hypothetical protein